MSAIVFNINCVDRDRLISFALAFLIHLAAFLGTGAVLVKSAEYGVEAGQGGIEVNLVAALPVVEEVKAEEAPPPQKVEEIRQVVEEEFILPKEEKPSALRPQPSAMIKGDGSSPVPGKDSTTLYSPGGALVEARPNYLKNPPPPYPESARKMEQEGLVELLVSVNRGGSADAVEIRKSSGFTLLDQAAVKAVRRWKFHAAKIGSLAVESKVEVPIRFRLSD